MSSLQLDLKVTSPCLGSRWKMEHSTNLSYHSKKKEILIINIQICSQNKKSRKENQNGKQEPVWLWVFRAKFSAPTKMSGGRVLNFNIQHKAEILDHTDYLRSEIKELYLSDSTISRQVQVANSRSSRTSARPRRSRKQAQKRNTELCMYTD